MEPVTTKILPAEWNKQAFVQLTWPHADTDWAYMLEEVTACFVQIAREICKRQQLLIVCADKNQICCHFSANELENIVFFETQTNDTWARDHGAICVFENNKPVVYDFTFNGWGMKFAANYDNLITGKLAKAGFLNAYAYRNCLDFILEGGSIESDGAGTLLTTAPCLLSDNRNNAEKEVIEKKLKDYFGVKQVLWLNHGYLAGDDTDSHVDTLARFCPNNTIAYVKCDDTEDEHYEALMQMENELKSFKTLEGESYRLIPLPMADAVYADHERLPATYANFLIINGAVLLPTYNSDKDAIAVEQMKLAFPEHQIVSIDCHALIKQHGSLHCVTMQYPSF